MSETATVNLHLENLVGDPDFFKALEELALLHDLKNRDYGTEEDPLANCRASEVWGISAWLGTMVRANDKMVRIQSFARKGSLANESLEDSLIDLAAYSLIALVLYRRSKK